jgi:hypothetical protein
MSSKQHHFVIYYDTDAYGFYLDDDSLHFSDGTIWHKGLEHWESRHDSDENYTLDERIAKAIHAMLDQFNSMGALPEPEEVTK